jgi:hypothetical protein
VALSYGVSSEIHDPSDHNATDADNATDATHEKATAIDQGSAFLSSDNGCSISLSQAWRHGPERDAAAFTWKLTEGLTRGIPSS